jgi:hypothetical protein
VGLGNSVKDNKGINRMLTKKSWIVLGKVAASYSFVAVVLSNLVLAKFDNLQALSFFSIAVIASFSTLFLIEQSSKSTENKNGN